jgi:pimeloyl-ACP methyl ester carboxylesterase
MDYVTAADGVKLAYDVTGAGTPLLCLPGLTRNMEDFEPVVEAYADRAQVIRMDFRGRGASDYADPATYQVPQEAQDVLTLLDHLKLPKVTILGTSRGGLVAMVLAATAKDRLAGVILNDVGPEIMAEGLAAIMTYIGRPPSHRTLVDAAGAMPAAYADSFQNVPPETWAAFARRLFREDRDGPAPALRPPPAGGRGTRLRPRCRGARSLAAFRRVRGPAAGPDPGGELEPAVGGNRRGDAAPPPRHGLWRGAPARPCALPRRARGAGRDHRRSGAGVMSDIGMIEAAAARAEGVVRRTPLLSSPFLDEIAGRPVHVKCEALQHTGSFKFRGGWSAVSALPQDVRARGVLAFSSGNHAQGVARAAELHGVPATIIMPADAPA